MHGTVFPTVLSPAGRFFSSAKTINQSPVVERPCDDFSSENMGFLTENTFLTSPLPVGAKRDILHGEGQTTRQTDIPGYSFL
jgi:hypothetical protein